MRIDGLIHRMGEITKQLKSFARKNTESFVPLNFNDAILEAMSIMEPQLKQSGIKIDTNIPSEPVLIVGDQQRLEQVIINLIRNAIDALDDTELLRLLFRCTKTILLDSQYGIMVKVSMI